MHHGRMAEAWSLCEEAHLLRYGALEPRVMMRMVHAGGCWVCVYGVCGGYGPV